MTRQSLTQNLKLLFAAHHFVFKSRDLKEIADAVNVKVSKIEYWMRSKEWHEALAFWGHAPKIGDLNFAEKLWTKMVQNNEHIAAIEYPDKPFQCAQGQGDSKVYALISSHLFCVDNLSGDEIRAKLAEDGNLVPCEDQHIRGYHWFAYPNEAEGLYSKVLARVNVAGDLIVDFGDEVCLVCIRHGRFTLTSKMADDVVNVLDKRLLIKTSESKTPIL